MPLGQTSPISDPYDSRRTTPSSDRDGKNTVTPRKRVPVAVRSDSLRIVHQATNVKLSVRPMPQAQDQV